MIDSQTAFEKRNAQLQKFIIGIPRRCRIAAVIVQPQTPISITASVTEVFSLSTLNLLNFLSPLPITRVCHGGGGKKRREADVGKWRECWSGGGYEPGLTQLEEAKRKTRTDVGASQQPPMGRLRGRN